MGSGVNRLDPVPTPVSTAEHAAPAADNVPTPAGMPGRWWPFRTRCLCAGLDTEGA